jgi:hypothetical protein
MGALWVNILEPRAIFVKLSNTTIRVRSGGKIRGLIINKEER